MIAALALLLACGTTADPPAAPLPSSRGPAEPSLAVRAAPAAPDAAVVPAPRLPAPVREAPPGQLEAYAARRVKTVVENQPWRRTTTGNIVGSGDRRGTATLVDLAPSTGVWLLLTVAWEGAPPDTWHLENPSGTARRVRLDPGWPSGLVLTDVGGDTRCSLWGAAGDALVAARATGRTYAPVCDGALLVRNPTKGNRTTLEWTTDFVRDHVWGGESITNMVKDILRESAPVDTSPVVAGRAAAPPTAGTPHPARLARDAQGSRIGRGSLGLTVEDGGTDTLAPGAWYPVRGVPHAWAGVVQARLLDPAVAAGLAPTAGPLTDTEGRSLVYSVAFDLDAFDLGFELGTDHPRLGWSGRVPAASKDPALPGPDGFDDASPLVRTGMLDPALRADTAVTFVGGFKRVHGAFARGELAQRNGGSHYGFVENGVELSRLHPGLATVVVDTDGRVDLLTWPETGAERLWTIRHARQNGVPVLEPDPATGITRPGALLRSWSAGSWSGSAEGELNTVRGGLCLQDTDAGRFLVYSYFSNASPSAMAVVYAAYDCDYAMLLDMNALEHTYLAALVPSGGTVTVEHLVQGMEVLDKTRAGALYPRFVGFADNRDFFYLLRRDGRPR